MVNIICHIYIVMGTISGWLRESEPKAKVYTVGIRTIV